MSCGAYSITGDLIFRSRSRARPENALLPGLFRALPPPVLTLQDRLGVSGANFCIILDRLALLSRRPTPSGLGLLGPGPWSLAPYLNQTTAKDYCLYEVPVSRSRSDNR